MFLLFLFNESLKATFVVRWLCDNGFHHGHHLLQVLGKTDECDRRAEKSCSGVDGCPIVVDDLCECVGVVIIGTGVDERYRRIGLQVASLMPFAGMEIEIDDDNLCVF